MIKSDQNGLRYYLLLRFFESQQIKERSSFLLLILIKMFASFTKTSVSALKRANFIRATCIAPTRMFSGVWNEAGAYTHPEGA